ncbi:hypothetical protein CY0110_18407 [Crocosphaera chwakensis CCY0110]|uniref:Uncharacterized protein n=1 Tax=Crocosphaera chwakensis CCY0110 TaxID=391612 RepID=A3IJ13_9CHRO|nr:hypothetical protein CY0110_18407 [Crocosphaera chwakensis CCY0110]
MGFCPVDCFLYHSQAINLVTVSTRHTA